MTVWQAVGEERRLAAGRSYEPPVLIEPTILGFCRLRGPSLDVHRSRRVVKEAIRLKPYPGRAGFSKLLTLPTGPLRLLVLCRYLRPQRCGLRDHHRRRSPVGTTMSK